MIPCAEGEHVRRDPHYCFHALAAAPRATASATTRSPAITLQAWRSRADADVTVPPPT
jgi:hypothetical protein